ncbi:MAG: ImmA/IrrE family metallo-endopeptidase [Lachnospiraceae bacterium]
MRNSRKKEIRIKANAFREKCKVSRYGIIDLFKECIRCGYKLIRYPLGEKADLGFTMKKDQEIIIFINTSTRLSREIFTLAHEIGHIILHIQGSTTFIDNTNTISSKSMDEKEQEANYFAVCLLMPEEELRKFLDLEMENFKENRWNVMDIARIMSEFSVSFDMTLNTLENLRLITTSERIRLDNEKNQTRVGNLLRSVGGNGKLNEVCNTIDIPHEYIDYVIYNYNHKAIPKETLEKALAYYHLEMDDIKDKLIDVEEEDTDDLDELIGGLDD